MKPFYQPKTLCLVCWPACLYPFPPVRHSPETQFLQLSTGGMTLGAFTTNGVPVNAQLISELNDPSGVVVSGFDLFIS